jgi:hypothetical protein
MESELRSLIGKYGMRAVHEGLTKEMRETFHYLQNVFTVKNELVVPVRHAVPIVEVVNDVIPDGVQPEEAHVETDSLVEDVAEMPVDPTVKQVVITNPKSAKLVSSSASVGSVDVKQQKQKHRDEVEKKRQELVGKGVKPESLLTEANLKKWIGDGQSYLKIAKETGVHENQVATLAKSFGLQSKISRYVAMKKTPQ